MLDSCPGPVRSTVTGHWECPRMAVEPEPGETWDDVCERCRAGYDAEVDRQVDVRRCICLDT